MSMSGGSGPGISFKTGGLAVIVGLLIIAVIAAFLIPTAVTELSGDETTTIDQDEGQTVLLKPQLNATLNDVDDGDSSINVTLADTTTNNSVSATSIAVGANETVTLETYDITINNTANVDTDTATIRYEYPRDYGWDSGASSIFGLIPLLLVLVFLLFVIGKAIDVI